MGEVSLFFWWRARGGSEYPAAVIPLGMQHYMLLERNLLYTAVTRGKRLVVVIGQTKALAMAVKIRGSVKRLTNLQFRLRHSELQLCQDLKHRRP